MIAIRHLSHSAIKINLVTIHLAMDCHHSDLPLSAMADSGITMYRPIGKATSFYYVLCRSLSRVRQSFISELIRAGTPVSLRYSQLLFFVNRSAFFDGFQYHDILDIIHRNCERIFIEYYQIGQFTFCKRALFIFLKVLVRRPLR